MTVERPASRVDRLERAEERNAVIRALVWGFRVLVLAAEVPWLCAVKSAHGVRRFTLPPTPHDPAAMSTRAWSWLPPAVAVRALLCHDPRSRCCRALSTLRPPGGDMRRRALLVNWRGRTIVAVGKDAITGIKILGLITVFALSSPAWAQSREPVHRVGVLFVGDMAAGDPRPVAGLMPAFLDRLADRGYVNGKNLVVEMRRGPYEKLWSLQRTSCD